MERTIKFVATAVKWRDRVNGNTYHSVRVTRCADGETLYCPFTYGYGDHYKQTALAAMQAAGWLPAKYVEKGAEFMYERENGYPILWQCTDGLKRDCVVNGKA